ncbi:MAG TPA: hypothetical protein VGK01_09910, partial [Candidatus Angelobacter sp.]
EKIPDNIPVETGYSTEFGDSAGLKKVEDFFKKVFGVQAPEAKIVIAVKEKTTGQCCEKESTEGNPKFEDKVEDSLQGSLEVRVAHIPISPFPEISGIITKIEGFLHTDIGLFADVTIEGGVTGQETTKKCDNSVEGEVSGSVAAKLAVKADFKLPGNVVKIDIGGEGGLSLKIGGRSSEAGTQIFFQGGTEPLTVGYEIDFLDGLFKKEQSVEILPEEPLVTVCRLHPEGTPWTTLTTCPGGGE